MIPGGVNQEAISGYVVVCYGCGWLAVGVRASRIRSASGGVQQQSVLGDV